MSFFQSLVNEHNLKRHDGRALWKYFLTEDDLHKLRNELQFKNLFTLDPRDATLYYAEWWKNNYNGGKPSKQEVFESLEGNITYWLNAEEFYQSARKGAEMLNYKWISKQYTLYFRTLLLQGGLPLRHIANNESNYLDFLLAAMELEPETIEDIMVEPEIVQLLPVSSRNEAIYENCLDIIKSYLEGEKTFDDLFELNKSVESISTKLKVKSEQIKRRKRRTKPKNYWLLNFNNNIGEINLRIGFADKYTPKQLSDILGIEPKGNQNHFYINDELICVFRKMLNGHYKTDWQHNQNFKWNGDNNLPEAYVVMNGEHYEVKDFIQIAPNPYEPSLWSKLTDEEWRLMKGNGSPNKEAAVLFPEDWSSKTEAESVLINNEKLSWTVFEGEIKLTNEEEKRTYLSNVKSIDWSITTNRPWWMKRASLPVVKGKPQVYVFDENNDRLSSSNYSLWIKKRNRTEDWKSLDHISYLDRGCYELKIQKGEIIAYDSFFNISSFTLSYSEQDSNYAKVSIERNGFDFFRLDETPSLSINENTNGFELVVNTDGLQIPNIVKGAVGLNKQKKLFFSLESPFEGTCIVDSEGNIIPESQNLFYDNLHGLRILSRKNIKTTITIFNPLAKHVKVIKPIKERSQSIIDIDSNNEIDKLFYLRDAMHHENKICLRISDNKQTKTYYVHRFSHTLNTDCQLKQKLYLEDSDDELDLYAIPVKGSAGSITAIPLVKEEDHYTFPVNITEKEFVIISALKEGKQLMPRFVSLEENDVQISKEERIKKYHEELVDAGFEEESWQQTLAYFEICNQFDIPFSTFDQIRAISISSEVAARSFFHFTTGINDMDEYIQQVIPALEKDLGFCFHWAYKEDWKSAIDEIALNVETQYFKNVIDLFTDYFKHNNLGKLANYIFRDNTSNGINIGHPQITQLRQSLGNKVLNELPAAMPIITSNYGIPIIHHRAVKLLLSSPVAVAESITGVDTDYPIWGQHHDLNIIRRNIQYSQDLNQGFYLDIILHVLQRN